MGTTTQMYKSMRSRSQDEMEKGQSEHEIEKCVSNKLCWTAT